MNAPESAPANGAEAGWPGLADRVCVVTGGAGGLGRTLLAQLPA